MAASMSEADDVIMYIMPQRIQKKMFQDLKTAVSKKRFHVSEKFRQGVSHIITQYTEMEQVLHQLQRDNTGIRTMEELDGMKVVTLPWLSACLKAGKIIPVEDRHLLHRKRETESKGHSSVTMQREEHLPVVAQWACQRVTPLIHYNHKFTDALETLEKHAEFRAGESDYPRALAFRRASCVLKSLPFKVERLSQVKGLKDVGGHAMKVIQSILEDGYCEEVETVCNEWFTLMKEFTSVFGVGQATAKKWIERGWTSISDARQCSDVSKDERIIWGLAFHEDLTTPVTATEAHRFLRLVTAHANNILPGVVTTLVGGFRRGKKSGHDVDILLTHAVEGREEGLLPALLTALSKTGLVLMGRREANAFSPANFLSDGGSGNMRGQHDHFEKWLGMVKLPEPAGDVDSMSDRSRVQETGKGKEETVESMQSDDPVDPGGDAGSVNSACSSTGNVAKSEMTGCTAGAKCKHKHENIERFCGASRKRNKEVCCDYPSQPKSYSLASEEKPGPDGDDCEPESKKEKVDEKMSPWYLAKSARNWKARRVDLVVTPYSQYYYALVGWTGSKQFNRDARLYAQRQLDMTLSSHGLWDVAKQQALPARSEEAVFRHLKLEYRLPADRNC